MTALDRLQHRLGHVFLDDRLLRTALTHRSFAHEHGGEDNERLEFLGDAVLQLATSALLAKRFPRAREGQLSRLRSRLVNTVALADIARQLELGTLLRLGAGEDSTGGRDKERNLANTAEAVLGAVFVEAGYEDAAQVAQTWVRVRLDALDDRDVDLHWKDPKSALQELTQRELQLTPRYVVLERHGPDHQPVFTVEAVIGDDPPRVLGRADGPNTKEASKRAATDALRNWDPS